LPPCFGRRADAHDVLFFALGSGTLAQWACPKCVWAVTVSRS